MMSRLAVPSLALLFFTLGLVGCSHQGPSSGSGFRPDPGSDAIRIYVTNRNFMDATVWAMTTGTRRKLGTITGKRDEVFTLPWDFATDLWLEIDMLAGGRCTTERLPVDPGDDIEVIIDVDMSGSPLCRGRSTPTPS
jgi:hypothetical protein